MSLAKILLLIREAAENYESSLTPGETLAYISEGSPYDTIFYRHLTDERWIPLLHEAGLFIQNSNPISGAGSTSRSRSLSLTALSNIASKDQDLTIAVLESIAPTESVNTDDILRCLSNLNNPRIADRALTIITPRIQNSEYHDWFFLDDLLSKWVEIGAHTEALNLLEVYLKHLAKLDERTRSNITYRLDEINRKVIQPLKSDHLGSIWKILFEILQTWRDSQIESGETNINTAPTCYWLHNFHSQRSYTHEFEATIAALLYEVCKEVFSSQSSTDKQHLEETIRGDSWGLFERLRWQLYADFPNHTKEWANKDVIDRIPHLGCTLYKHGNEFSQLLTNHSISFSHDFLSKYDLDRFFYAVIEGIYDHDGGKVENDDWSRRFKQQQLQPISKLLSEEQYAQYNTLDESGSGETRVNTNESIYSGESKTIIYVSPMSAEQLAGMPQGELWDFLNDWTPSGDGREFDEWWKELNAGALGEQFAKLITDRPDHLPVESRWWTNITRSEVLTKIIEAATKQINATPPSLPESESTFIEPNEDQWITWLGVVDQIIELAEAASPPELSRDDKWRWPHQVAVRFLGESIGSDSNTSIDLNEQIGTRLKRVLLNTENRRHEKSEWGDWLAVAINTAEGVALEALISLAVKQKKESDANEPESWIFETIQEILVYPTSSPVYFAIMGSRLHPLLYLYSEQLRHYPKLLLPDDSPNYTEAFLSSHIMYGNPLSGLLSIIPSYMDAALSTLSRLNEQIEFEDNKHTEFGGRLGIHIAYYYWNQEFEDEIDANETLQNYFSLASSSQSAKAIREIGGVFKNTEPTDPINPQIERVMELWELRFTQICDSLEAGTLSKPDIQDELGSFISWFEIEAIPFEWRLARVLEVIQYCERQPNRILFMKSFKNNTEDPLRLQGTLKMLNALIALESDTISWTYHSDDLIPMLRAGFTSDDEYTKNLAHDLQESLLRRECFDFLDV